ncbi:MAG: L-lysine 6-transaminase [Vicinamibacteria bacterium]|nr:L-lysine 6-transaminase [Vicinamibacteria bacterium]
MTAQTVPQIAPAEVHASLGRYILADGYDIVFDYERSHGSWIYDSRKGREILDFFSFFASHPIGYNHPKMKDPAFQQVLVRVAQLKPSISDIYPVEYAQFVDVFGRVAMPKHLPHAFFVEGGALGNENALKTAFDWKVRRNRAKGIPGEKGQQIIHFREAFHGRSGYTMSLTNTDPKKVDLFPKFPWPRIDNPKLRFPLTDEVVRDVVAAEQRALEQIRKAFEDNPDDIAAIIIEPIQAEGGDNHFRAEFLQALQRVCDENEVFFIVDEVQTGVGMTGKFWAHEHFGIQPDALSFGKKMQVGGCLVGPKVDREPENVFKVSSRINSTWGGNLTDMVRAMRFLEIIEEDQLVENARVVGDHLLAGLRDVEREHAPLVSGARGRGLMIAFDLPDGAIRDKLQDKALDLGLMILTCGPRSIRFRPALNLTKADADAGLDVLRRALKQI